MAEVIYDATSRAEFSDGHIRRVKIVLSRAEYDYLLNTFRDGLTSLLLDAAGWYFSSSTMGIVNIKILSTRTEVFLVSHDVDKVGFLIAWLLLAARGCHD